MSKTTDTISSALLIAGTTIGAGILALPSVTFNSGLVPSSIVLLVAWIFTLQAGLLIAEATQRVGLKKGRLGFGFVATVGEILGKNMQRVATIAFGFVCYTVMVAYVAQGGVLLSPYFKNPATIFSVGLGLLLTFGSPLFIDACNNILVAAVVVTFGAVVFLGVPHVRLANLARMNWMAAPAALPISVLSLVYHTVVPHVVEKLEGDAPLIVSALLAGSLLPLVMFCAWNTVVLGSVPFSQTATLSDPLSFLSKPGSGTSAPLGLTVSIFSQCAIITSAIGIYFGLKSFIVDVFGLSLSDEQSNLQKIFITLGILGFPLMCAVLKPDAFLTALDFAGCFGVTTLFGIIPVVAVWKLRSEKKPQMRWRRTRIIYENLLQAPGGNAALVVQLLLSLLIIGDGVARLVITPP